MMNGHFTHFKSLADQCARYLIVAGTTKAASTSLFIYLSDHPQIAPQIQKESGYWHDADYPSKIGERYTSDITYSDCFDSPQSDQVRLDITPTYMYSLGTPARIKKYLSDYYIYFTFREPISKFISKFRYLQQLGYLSNQTRIGDFVQELFAIKEPVTYTHSGAQRSLVQGNYHEYISHYLEVFPKKLIEVIYYEDWVKAPARTLISMCEKVEISPSFYDDYIFNVVNKTRVISNKRVERGYHRIKKSIATRTKKSPQLHSVGVGLKGYVEPLVYWLNGERASNRVSLSDADFARLRDYYRPSVERLDALYPVPKSWREVYQL